jgi:pre-mRNA-processing factor 17
MTTSTKGSVPTGFADEIVISDTTFRNAHRGEVVKAGTKRKREGKGDSAAVYGANAYKGPWAKFRDPTPEDSGSEEEVTDYGSEEEAEEPALPNLATDYATSELGETTEFHGSQLHDYQGRTYMHVPLDLDVDLRGSTDELKNYVPKKNIFTWTQHTGHAITQMHFMPNSGHLLLAASASGKVKLFDVYHDRELLRTYSGHTKSCNDVSFNNDGTAFLTASYDRYMKVWDTETGQCKAKFTTGKTAHVVRYYPLDNNQFIAGMSDKTIQQFDIRSGETTQVYDHHLGAVNTLTFVENGMCSRHTIGACSWCWACRH